MANDQNNLEACVQVITLVIHMVTLFLLFCGGRFVYKATAFRNKYIMAMILLLFLAVVLDSVFQFGFYLASYEEKDYIYN